MANITFFEKPGCQNNRRQKEWLQLAGHSLEVVDLLSHPWSNDELRKFLAGKDVAGYFNTAAPDIRDGRLDPASLSEQEAIDLMARNPLLIRRPLMIIDGRYVQGFDTALLRTFISLEPVAGAEQVVESFKMLDMNACHSPAGTICTITKED
ncbi:MAG: arsenate reductase family protein [Chlorobiaceae bacterium]|nr:arsenate reductase family protein [Chlorobiaceae bacterium]NTW73526.1 arsenate reductase family protein [Chlorobiaceae bacterium]